MGKKSPEAALAANTSYTRLMSLIRYGKLAAPAKDSSGDYVWTDADIERVKQAINSTRKEGIPCT